MQERKLNSFWVNLKLRLGGNKEAKKLSGLDYNKYLVTPDSVTNAHKTKEVKSLVENAIVTTWEYGEKWKFLINKNGIFIKEVPHDIYHSVKYDTKCDLFMMRDFMANPGETYIETFNSHYIRWKISTQKSHDINVVTSELLFFKTISEIKLKRPKNVNPYEIYGRTGSGKTQVLQEKRVPFALLLDEFGSFGSPLRATK